MPGMVDIGKTREEVLKSIEALRESCCPSSAEPPLDEVIGVVAVALRYASYLHYRAVKAMRHLRLKMNVREAEVVEHGYMYYLPRTGFRDGKKDLRRIRRLASLGELLLFAETPQERACTTFYTVYTPKRGFSLDIDTVAGVFGIRVPVAVLPRWRSIATIATCCNDLYKRVVEYRIISKADRSMSYRDYYTTPAPRYRILKILDTVPVGPDFIDKVLGQV